jgi:hypothetical protein
LREKAVATQLALDSGVRVSEGCARGDREREREIGRVRRAGGERDVKSMNATTDKHQNSQERGVYIDNLRLRATKNSVFPVVVRGRNLPLASAQDPNPRAAGSMAAVEIADANRRAI